MAGRTAGPGLPANHVLAERCARLCRPLFVTVAIAPFPLVFVLPHLEQVRFDARSGGPRARNRFQQPVGGKGTGFSSNWGPPLPPRATAAFRSNRPLYLPTFPHRRVPLRLIKCYLQSYYFMSRKYRHILNFPPFDSMNEQ